MLHAAVTRDMCSRMWALDVTYTQPSLGLIKKITLHAYKKSLFRLIHCVCVCVNINKPWGNNGRTKFLGRDTHEQTFLHALLDPKILHCQFFFLWSSFASLNRWQSDRRITGTKSNKGYEQNSSVEAYLDYRLTRFCTCL